MDIPRYALIAASLLLGLMLLGEWTRFTESEQALIPPSPIVESLAPDNTASWADTDASRPSMSTEGDIPSAEDIALPQGTRTDSITSSDTGSLVTVKTDVLNVVIDLQGGDVVGAAFRDYPKTLDDPSDPFVLLERNARRIYIAQSGLVGPDGIDQKNRAVYQA
ncbi:MAG: membrane protein insertase YidC, partial [Halieaceae bacterium]